MFPFKSRPKIYFTAAERQQIVDTIRLAEKHTSGEVRVYVESHCRWMDAVDRAREVFFYLKMEKTEMRNATLVYVAMKDQQMAIFGDEGIYEKTGQPFWNEALKRIMQNPEEGNIPAGIIHAVEEIGNALSQHFPYDSHTDKNELPDEIVFGK